MSLKKDLIIHLNEMADLLEFLGENKFKINAYKNGANSIKHLEDDLEVMIAENRLKDVPGIGKGLQNIIQEFYDNGYSIEHEGLLLKVPEGLPELFQVRGLGAKKIKILNSELNVENLQNLEEVCKSGQLQGIKGFTENTSRGILKEIKRIRSSQGLIHNHRAEKLAEFIINELKNIDGVIKCRISGDLRRGNEVIRNLRICILVKNPDLFEKELCNLYQVNKLSDSPYDEYLLNVESKIIPKLYVSKNRYHFNAALFESTGSDEFLEFIEYSRDDIFRTEIEYFESKKLPYLIPEMREKEIIHAPVKFHENSNLTLDSMNALLHFHTTYSDGSNSLKEMVETAKEIGFTYAAVCDHSKSAFYANGLSEERILLQKKEIEEVKNELNFPIYHGIESDILRDGSLDYTEEHLKLFNFIVASIHSGFNLEEDEMTNRIIKAIENPYTDLLGHPTGRLLLTRDPYPHNIEKIIDACVANDVAIEINSNPHRLDLDWRNILYARDKGCKFAINADAHSVDGLKDIKYGLNIARKGGVQTNEVINCFEENTFVQYINRRVSRNS